MRNIFKFLFAFIVVVAFSISLASILPASAQAPDKINICHKTGSSWQFMTTPAGESLDGHLGHGDFYFAGDTELTEEEMTAWCIANAPEEEQLDPTLTLTKTVAYNPTKQTATYTINWEVKDADVDNLTLTDTLPAWVDGVVGTISSPTTPVLAPGDLNFDSSDPSDNREIVWNLGAQAKNASGSITFKVELLAEDTCEVDGNAVDALATYGDGASVEASTSSDEISIEDPRCDVPEETTATISAVKIVCDSEDDLPNWGADGADITASTATDFLADDLAKDQKQDCHLDDWRFQWAPEGTANPGDNVNLADAPWTTFNTESDITVPAGSKIWVREQAKDTYIPFSGANSNLEDEASKNSAEFYCSNDVLNYDNYDFIDPVEAGETYHCIGFNVLKEQPPACDAEASQTIMSDTDTQVDTHDALPLSFIHTAWTASIPGATWIWATDPVESPTNDADLTKTFTRTFSIVGTPTGGTLNIASDNHYTAKVNGNVLPVVFDEDNFQLATQDSYDVSAYLVNGLNTLEIEVTNKEIGESADPAANPAGLLYKLSLTNNECEIPEPNTADITIIKETEGGDGEFHFNGLSGEDGFDLTTVEGTASETFTVPADTYVITENVPTGWNLTSVSCIYDEESVGEAVADGKEVTVGPGDHVTCTFLNTKVQEPPACPAAYTDNSDNSGAIRFETDQSYALGSINGQNGWSATGPYDQEIVSQSTYASFEEQSLRMSDAQTSGSFGDWVFAQPLSNAAGEADSTNGAFSPGTLQDHFEAQFDIASFLPCVQQPGLHISVSPDRGDGSRMSYLRFEDGVDGLDIFFDDVQGTSNPANFVETQIADGLERSIPHKVKFVMDFNDGTSNDVIKIFLDGVLVHTGTSWENYYRYDSEAIAEQSPRIVKTLIFQARGTSTPANAGNGYLFDNLSMVSSSPQQSFQCSDGVDNDDTEDSLADSADPACHSDLDVNNSSTYTPNADSETNSESTQCSDGISNDQDGLIDSLDPGCWVNQDQPESGYNPDDNDEQNTINEIQEESRSSSGNSSGSRANRPAGQVLGAETSCGIYVDKFLRKGYNNNAAAVIKVQKFLNDFTGTKLLLDGIFGTNTETALKAFQYKHREKILTPWGITEPTGIFYLTTQTEVNNIMCPTLGLPIPTNLVNFTSGVIN